MKLKTIAIGIALCMANIAFPAVTLQSSGFGNGNSRGILHSSGFGNSNSRRTMSEVSEWACSQCDGTGLEPCPMCNGSGTLGPDMRPCEKCFVGMRRPGSRGTGTQKCRKCHGSGRMSASERKRKERVQEERNLLKILEHEKMIAVCNSLIGAVDEIKPMTTTSGEWGLGPGMRVEGKDYRWTPDDAKRMPARCPFVFQVIGNRSFLVRSQCSDTLVIIDTIDDYNVCDGKPFQRWGVYRYMGPKSYHTALGSTATVPYIKQVQVGPAAQPETRSAPTGITVVELEDTDLTQPAASDDVMIELTPQDWEKVKAVVDRKGSVYFKKSKVRIVITRNVKKG